MNTLDRRGFIKLMGMVGLTVATPWPIRLASAQSADPYTGPIFVTVAASGGWDPTSFCDPKENVPGEREITQWSRNDVTRTITGSPITYAPFANNQQFFERFYADTLVLNGIDAATNSHDVGVRHTWSGQIPAGYPSFSAIAAAVYGSGMPLPYLTNGGYRETAGLATYAEVSNVRDIQDLINVNRVPNKDDLYHDEDEVAVIERYMGERLAAQQAGTHLLPRQRSTMANLVYARANRDQLQALTVGLPDQLVNPIDQDGLRNDLLQQAQMALICSAAGLTVACDLEIGGFDTHSNHDNNHGPALQRLTNGITYLWDTAEAMGLADRLVVLVGSDFGRTPRYNDGNGKDHWPINSALVMKKNVAWTNRVVGASDEGHSALAINPTTLAVDNGPSGVVLTPAHVQGVLREAAGVAADPVVSDFPLNALFVDLLNPGV
jgi:hypothetical protein